MEDDFLLTAPLNLDLDPDFAITIVGENIVVQFDQFVQDRQVGCITSHRHLLKQKNWIETQV